MEEKEVAGPDNGQYCRDELDSDDRNCCTGTGNRGCGTSTSTRGRGASTSSSADGCRTRADHNDSDHQHAGQCEG